MISIAFSAKAAENSLLSVLTYDSRACVKTSMPVSAVILGGTDFTSTASKIASSGSKESLESGVFVWFSGSLITEKDVTSLPVPLVVGIAIKCGA